jgi:hypothetical protein
MRKLKLYINHKLYDISRGLLDWAVKNRHWKLAGTISGWRNRLVIPILEDLHRRFIVTPAPIQIAEIETAPKKTKTTRRKKVQRVKKRVR